MNYNIKILDADSSLDDHELFMKVYNEIENSYETIVDFQGLQEQITREINLFRNREICNCCDGAGMVKGLKCIGGCFGKGYISEES